MEFAERYGQWAIVVGASEGVGASVADVGGPWLLRFAAVQPGQRSVAAAGCAAGGVATAVGHNRRGVRASRMKYQQVLGLLGAQRQFIADLRT